MKATDMRTSFSCSVCRSTNNFLIYVPFNFGHCGEILVRFFSKISLLIVKNVIFNGKKKLQSFSQCADPQMIVQQTVAPLSLFIP